MQRIKIALRVFGDPGWQGGINYIINWAKMLNMLPVDIKPELCFVYFNESGRKIAEQNSELVNRIIDIRQLNDRMVDFYFPVTQVDEAPSGIPWAGWIPDWQFAYWPEMFTPTEIQKRMLSNSILAVKSPLVVVSSEMAKQDTLRQVHDPCTDIFKLDFSSVIDPICFKPGEKETQSVFEKYNIYRRYFIVCNQFWKHKNHSVVFKSISMIKDMGVLCVFTGATHDSRFPHYFNQIKKIVKQNGIEKNVIILGSIPRSDQICLMKGAIALIQPSLFEGWNTSVEEAKALGKTVVLSEFPVHREQSDSRSIFFQPHDETELADIMIRLYQKATDQNIDGNIYHFDQNRNTLEDQAREFLNMAELCIKNYSMTIHDPNSIITDMLYGTRRDYYLALSRKTRKRFEAQYRGFLLLAPWKLLERIDYNLKNYPKYLKEFKSTIVRVMIHLSLQNYSSLLNEIIAKLDYSFLYAFLLRRVHFWKMIVSFRSLVGKTMIVKSI